jgi:tetratricopeptide (TPR) repeat protein
VVLQQGPAVLAMYPEFVGDANGYELIADAAQMRGDAKTETAMLTAYMHEGGQNPALLKRLAGLQEKAGQHGDAAATLERLNYIYPVKDEDLHRQLGDLLFAEKRFAGAVREYNAVVASHPIDKAGAEFKLAQAYLAAGKKDKAQESVLAALETAPGYRPAQKLLLELQEPSPKTN